MQETYFVIQTNEGESYITKYNRISLLTFLNQIGKLSHEQGSLWFAADSDIMDFPTCICHVCQNDMLIIKGSVVIPEVTQVAIAYDLPREENDV